MDSNEILELKNPTSFDRMVSFVYGQISMLHNQKIPEEEMREIKNKISEFIRKHNPLENILIKEVKNNED